MKTWILECFQLISRSCLAAATFLAPVVFWRQAQEPFNLPKLTALWILGLGAMAAYVIWSAERGVWLPRFNLSYPVAGFIAACLLSTLLSESPALSLRGLYGRYGGFISLVLYATIFFAFVGVYWERPAALSDIARAVAAAAGVLTVYILIQAAGQDWNTWRDPSEAVAPAYPVGTMGNSNFAGGYLAIALPFLVYVAAVARKEIYKITLFCLVGLSILALWFTQSRGGMIAAFAALVAMGFAYRDRLPGWIRITAIASVFIAIIMAVAVLWHPGSGRPYGPLTKVETFNTSTFTFRTYYWRTALRVFKYRPITGVGPDRYYAYYPKFRLPEDGAALGLLVADKPHSIYLEYLADTGLIGFTAYMALIGLALWYGFRSGMNQSIEGLLAAAFVGALVGYLAQGAFSIDEPPLAAMGWISLGGVAVLGDPRIIAARRAVESSIKAGKSKAKKSRQRSGSTKEIRVSRHGPICWPVHTTVVGVVAILTLVGIRPLMADMKARDAVDMYGSPGQKVAATFDEAIRLNPMESNYHWQAAGWAKSQAADPTKDRATKEGFYRKALDHYEKALALQPGDISYIADIAALNTIWAQSTDPDRFPEAERWWKKAVAHDPTDWEVRNGYARMLDSYAKARSENVN